ncbi:MAG: endonuclease domain-containing protein [Acidiferrobacterales bacterium]|nr:endonuclease domain-containing protein [Acidiferrobacterales bacterium]
MTARRDVPKRSVPDSVVTEWVEIIADGRLAIVQQRTSRGVRVKLPLGGRELVLPIHTTRPFKPENYPVQLSAAKRKKMKQNGETPRDEIEKVCNQCFTIKSVECFAANQTRKDGSTIYRPTCMDCRQGVDGVSNHATRRDGTIPEEPKLGTFWKCPICEKEGIVGVTVKLVLDHGHLTGDARDYICDSCNTGLGRFRNGKNFLKTAVIYLEKWEPGKA